MSITREDAIAVLEGSKRQNEVMRDNPSTFWASHQMAEGVKTTERRIAALDLALAALRGPTREMVERMKGKWEAVPRFGVYDTACSKCGYAPGIRFFSSDFCPACGSPMTNKAVDMMLERWKEAVDCETCGR